MRAFLSVALTIGFSISAFAEEAKPRNPAAEAQMYCGFLSSREITADNFGELVDQAKANKLIPIAMELAKTPKQKNRYFYRKERKEIPLSVQRTDKGRIILKAKGETFDFKEETVDNVEKSLLGKWTSGGKTYFAALAREEGEEIGFNEALNERPVKAPIANGGTKIEFASVAPNFHYFVPKLVSIEGGARGKGFAAWAKELGAAENDAPCGDLIFSQNLEVKLIGPYVVWARLGVSGMGHGAAYPNNNEGDARLYDLKYDREIKTKDVFKNDAKSLKALTLLFFAKALRERAESSSAPSEDDSCYAGVDPDIPDDFSSLSLDLKDGRVGMTREFPHVANGCNGEYEWVPFAKLKPYMKPGNSIYDLVTGTAR